MYSEWGDGAFSVHVSAFEDVDRFSAFPSAVGIYRIGCLRNGEQYVGKALNLKSRLKTHFRYLNEGRHHAKLLQSDFEAYGKDCFVFEVLQLLPYRNANAFGVLVAEWDWTKRLKAEYGGARSDPQKLIARFYAEGIKNAISSVDHAHWKRNSRHKIFGVSAVKQWLANYPKEFMIVDGNGILDAKYAEFCCLFKCLEEFRDYPESSDLIRSILSSYLLFCSLDRLPGRVPLTIRQSSLWGSLKESVDSFYS